MNRPHQRKWRSEGYNPFEMRTETYVRCAICGFAGIDAERTNEPEIAPGQQVTTGTVYQVPVGASADQLPTLLDQETITIIPKRSACAFCGSPAWAWGSAPDLHGMKGH